MSAAVVAVFGSSQTPRESAAWMDAVRVGRVLGESGYGVVTGGYGGTMEAVSDGAARSGARVVGVTAPLLFPGRTRENPHVAELHEAPTLSARIGLMMSMAAGAIILPGSIGTATELLVAWNTNHIMRRNGGVSFPSAAVGPEWRTVGETLAGALAAEMDDIHWADTPDDAVEWLLGRLESIEAGPPAPRL